MKFINVILKRPVSVVVLLVAVVLYGAAALTSMPMNFMPEFNMPMELVLITWPGADADSVDRLLAEPITDECETLTDINSVGSNSYDNYVMIQLIYNYGADTDDMYSDLKSALDNLKPELPEDCGDPVIMELDMSAMPTLTASAVAEEGVDVSRYLNDEVVPALESLGGVARVEVSGTQDEYVRIVLNDEKLRQYGLSIQAVGGAIAAADFDLPVGAVSLGSQDVTLSASGNLSIGRELGALPIQTPMGQQVRLGDITDFLGVDLEDAESLSRYNGQESVLLSVTKQDSAAAVGVCDEVVSVLESFDGVSFDIINNEADNILDALLNILQTLLVGVALAMLILFIFFGDVRASFVVSLSMPLSILLAMILLNFFGFDLNVLSGTGLILAIGMIVDNSIVILESCFRAHEEGLEFREAAAQGTSSMLMSILAGTLTTVVVYFPLAISEGLAGMMFGPLLWTIVLTMLASFLCAVVVVPLAFFWLKPRQKGDIPINRMLRSFQGFYRKIMPRLLCRPGQVMLVAVACFAGAIALAMQMEFIMMPSNYDGSIEVSASFRSGTRLEVMDQQVRSMEAVLLEDEQFESVTLDLSEDTAAFTAYAVDGCERSSEAAVEYYTARFGGYPGMDVSVSPAASTSGMEGMAGDSNSKTIMLLGDDMDSLQEGAEQVREVMAQTPGVIRVENPFDRSRVKGYLNIDPQKALSAGTSQAAVAMEAFYLLNGMTAGAIDDGESEYDVVVEFPEGRYEDVLSLMDYSVTAPTGRKTALRDIAEVSYGTTLPVIIRQDGQYAVTLTATTTDASKYTAADAIQAGAEALDFPEGVSIGLSAQDSTSNDEIAGFAMALLSSLFLVFLVMAVQFNSVRLSIMVMLCIPLSLIGSFGLSFLAGKPLSLFGMMGFMMLIGITVNNGIYLVDGTTQLRQTMPLENALVEAGVTRLRPILMTTLTTVISMVPMIFTTNTSMQMMKEMAYIVIGGLVASTVLAMFLIPAFYLIMQGERLDGTRRRGRKKQPAAV